MHFRNRTLAYIAMAVAFAAPLKAQNVTPNYGTAVPIATTDRYDPASWLLTNATHGRNDVLNIGIDHSTDASTRGGQSGTFYNTQGKDLAVSANGSWLLTSDLWVDAAWQTGSTTNLERTDMWGVAVDGSITKDVSDYAIIGFTNYNPDLNSPETGTFRDWNSTGAGSWTDVSAPVNYNAWNTLAISFDEPTHVFSYFVNGVAVAGGFADAAAEGIGADLMQAYNFNDPTLDGGVINDPAYTALWSNTPAAVTGTPEPATIGLMATGLVGLGGFFRRRRAQQVVS